MNGGQVEILLGDSFEVQLAENPTTGYRWLLHSTQGRTIEIQEDSFQARGGAIGAGGIRRWRFRASETGPADLEFEYRKSWEKKAVETFKVAVRVKPS